MTLLKNNESFWIQSLASDLQNCAYNLAQNSVDEAEIFLMHARKIFVNIENTRVNEDIIRYLNRSCRSESTIERLRLADKYSTFADILLLQSLS